MTRCKFPLAEMTTRSMGVKAPAIDTEVSQPPIISPSKMETKESEKGLDKS